MRWVPVGLVGAAAAWLGWAAGPLFDNWSDSPAELNPLIPTSWIMIILYAPFFVAVVGAAVMAFRALWLSTQRAELAARFALGSPRGALVRSEARTGLRDGLLAGGSGVALGLAARQIQTGASDVVLVADAAWTALTVICIAALSFTVAYAAAAIWATRGSVRTVASGAAPERSADARPRHGRRRILLSVAIGLAAASALALVTQPSFLQWDGLATGPLVAVQIVVTILLGIGLYLAVPGVLIYAGAKGGAALARTMGRAVARSAAPGSARSLASTGLAADAPARTGAVAAVVAVMGASVTMTAMYYGLEDANDAGDDLAPHGVVSTVDLLAAGYESELDGDPGDGIAGELAEDTPSGWSAGLPQDVVRALHDDPALIVVDAGVLTTDAHERTYEDEWGRPHDTWARAQLLAVDPDALDALSPDAARRLYLADGTEWVNGALGTGISLGPDEEGLEVNGVEAPVEETNGPTPWAGISRPWAERVWGEGPTAAMLLYPAGQQSVGDALAAHDLGGLEVVDLGPRPAWRSSATGQTVAAVTTPFLLIAVAIVVALAWAGQRLRARDQATLLALGATPGALRGAAALESFLLTMAAGIVGCMGGAVLGPVLSELGFSVPVAAVGPGVVLWNMGHTLAIMPWGLLAGLVLAAAALAAGGAALIRVRMDRLTPAQQLADAQKAGIS